MNTRKKADVASNAPAENMADRPAEKVSLQKLMQEMEEHRQSYEYEEVEEEKPGVWIDFCDPAQLDERRSWARSLQGDSAIMIRQILTKCTLLGHRRRVAGPPPLAVLEDIERDFPHCWEVLATIRRRIVLSNLTPRGALKLPPILLAGPPGTGKTAFSKRLSSAMGVPISFIDMSTVESPFSIVGLDASYSTGKPGLIWDALQNECVSPVLVLDELDKQSEKLRESCMGFLLGLTEPSTARQFIDACMGLPVNASHIQWIATCNDLGAVPSALLSRMRLFHIELPTAEQMPAVISSVYRELQEREPWAKLFAPLSEAVVAELALRSPREIRMSLEDACANAAEDGRREVQCTDLPHTTELSNAKTVMGFI